MPKNDRSIRGNRRGRDTNICDRSGSSVNERFAGWKVSPSCWKDAGEAEWWRHGRCDQVARKDAAGRSPVHPFAPFHPLAAGCPPRRRSLYVHGGIHVYTNMYTHIRGWIHRRSLSSSLLSCRPSPILSSFCISMFYPPSPPFGRRRSRSERERSLN